jgi:hypothetical protein
MNPVQVVATVLGVTAQLVGVIITVRGVRDTWRKHPTGEPFWTPQRRWFGARRAWFRRVVLRRRTVASVTLSGAVNLQGVVTLTASGFVTTALPDDLAAFRVEVGRRLYALNLAAQQADAALATERTARETADRALRGMVDDQKAATEQLVHGVATEGLREQVLGAGLVVLGVVCQVLAGL